MRFGFMYDFRNPQEWRRPWPDVYAEQLDEIVRLEELGYDDVWLTEHHFVVEDGYNPSVLPVAAAIAARTSRIRIGSFIIILPFHNPVRLAEDAAMVDCLSGGRFDLGVGMGYRIEEFEGFDVPRRERGARFEEAVQLIQRLWTEEDVDFDGRFTQVNGVTISPPCVQEPHVPIWIGGRTDKAVRRAARLGTNLQVTLGPDPAPVYQEALRDEGRDPDDFAVAQLRTVYVAETADQAWDELQDHVHYMMTWYSKPLAEANDVQGDDAMWDLARPEDLRDSPYAELLMVGDPDQVAAKLERFQAEFACTHLVMATHLAGMESATVLRSADLFAQEVMPRFRQEPAVAR